MVYKLALGGSVSTASFRNEFIQNNQMFSGYYQQDAQEFIVSLLDMMHEGTLYKNTKNTNSDEGLWHKIKEKVGISNKITNKDTLGERKKNMNSDEVTSSNTGGEKDKKMDVVSEFSTIGKKSMISELFYGKIKKNIICKECGNKTSRIESFMTLDVPIPLDIVTLYCGYDDFKVYKVSRFISYRTPLSFLGNEEILLIVYEKDNIFKLIEKIGTVTCGGRGLW